MVTHVQCHYIKCIYNYCDQSYIDRRIIYSVESDVWIDWYI